MKSIKEVCAQIRMTEQKLRNTPIDTGAFTKAVEELRSAKIDIRHFKAALLKWQ